MKDEVWKDIPGYEGYYQASTLGRIKSFARVRIGVNGKLRNFPPLILSLNPHKHDGYVIVVLVKNNKARSFRVHLIIMKTFFGDSDKFIDHINGIRDDNRVENLRYCTHRENITFNNVRRIKSSKYIGVSKSGKKYKASFCINGVKLHLGTFINEIDAHKAYLSKVNEHK